MIKAVIFDMDGVLINTEPLHYQCWVEIFKERYGIDLDYDVYKPCIGSTRLHFMNLIKENYGITFESLAVMNQIMKEKKDESKEKQLQYPRKRAESLQRAKPRGKNRDG